jgi:hypothetical protein
LAPDFTGIGAITDGRGVAPGVGALGVAGEVPGDKGRVSVLPCFTAPVSAPPATTAGLAGIGDLAAGGVAPGVEPALGATTGGVVTPVAGTSTRRAGSARGVVLALGVLVSIGADGLELEHAESAKTAPQPNKKLNVLKHFEFFCMSMTCFLIAFRPLTGRIVPHLSPSSRSPSLRSDRSPVTLDVFRRPVSLSAPLF